MQKMEKQILYIWGWVAKENYISYLDYVWHIQVDPYQEKFLNWSKTLGENLLDFEYLIFDRPNSDFADYQAWKIMFEKYLPFLKDEIILIWTSLGWTFLLKYFWENKINKKISKIFLLASATDDTEDEKIWTFELKNFEPKNFLENIWKAKLYLYHSKDDECVPFWQFLKLEKFFPDSEKRIFENKNHFWQETRILELEQDIKN